MRNLVRALRVLTAFCLMWTIVLVAPPTAAAAPFCGITWGSGEKSRWTEPESVIRGVRAGQHDCYDRLVVDFTGYAGQDFQVRYQDHIFDFLTWQNITLRGGAYLEVLLDSDNGQFADPATRTELVDVGAYRTFRQIAYAGEHRAGSYLALGVRARLPFRAFVLQAPGQPTRLVVDVAHQW
ncbi:hypothetical protein [Actinokineospora sp. NBRC 105648]|uniref:AMIN-like domain-containing (lipo)protein n=1 Tax=Actinokineospora sp. NBRC 105648 TaxID=3032206 RepID=UPI0024A54845|nr:hypothetical protein [Actinokineospora sp. NBRC 105648]GLZ38572.1 hypothetical protein Acsp05_21960 [Actinokineospora sp. NBRC 105648]